jgi:hypothetical protein
MKVFRKLWLISSLHSRFSMGELQRPLGFVEPQARLFSFESPPACPATMGCAESKPTLPSSLDLLSLDATELQSLFAARKLTSAQLVQACLEQIRKQDQNGLKLNAIIATPPEEDLIKIAKDLDDEREGGNLRGPLHGIPIIVKVPARKIIPPKSACLGSCLFCHLLGCYRNRPKIQDENNLWVPCFG